ncbi:MAG: response regulator [Desulfobulbaceae bacterium]|nr:response regulator [Desulfobulbaceae bacterium]
MNDNIYDSMYIDRSFAVDVDLINRVEVVRGPSSSLYGSSAFFGVVNVITKKGRDLQGFEVSGSVGSFDSYQGRLSYGQRFDNGFEMLVSGTYYDSNGDDLYYQEFDDPVSNNGIVENADDENVQNLFAKLSFGDFIMEGAYVNREKGIPTASYDTVFNDSRTRTWEKHTYLDLKYQHLMENAIELTARLYYDHYEYDGDWAYDYSEDGDLSDVEIFYDLADGKWWGTEVLATRPLFEQHKLTLGAEYRDSLRQQQKEWDVYEVYFDGDNDDYTWAFFLQDEYKILDNLIFNLGVRYDYFDTVGSTTNPRAALIYSPLASTNLKLLTVIGQKTKHEPSHLVTRHSIVEDRRLLDLSVLVAEDNETNQEVAVGMLKKFGCRINLVSNGKEAVDAVTEKSYDLIFMDCQMPVMDGYQATAAIRKMEEKEGLKNHTPIIALTANALEGDREKCLSAGMDDYISKPFKQDEILKILEHWSHGKQLKFTKDESIKHTKSEMAGSEQSHGEHPKKEAEISSLPIDRSVLSALRNLQMEGKPDILVRIVNAYLSSSEPLIAELREALAVNDLEVLQNTAHSLKSSSANVGAVKLAEISKELEMGCRNNTLGNAADLVSAIKSEFIRVKDELNKEIHST